MDNKDLINQIIEGSADYEDGEMGVNRCIHEYCADHGITDEDIIDQACNEAFKRGALEAGIPLSVIERRTKLSDHFSKEYIQSQCDPNGLNRTGDE